MWVWSEQFSLNKCTPLSPPAKKILYETLLNSHAMVHACFSYHVTYAGWCLVCTFRWSHCCRNSCKVTWLKTPVEGTWIALKVGVIFTGLSRCRGRSTSWTRTSCASATAMPWHTLVRTGIGSSSFQSYVIVVSCSGWPQMPLQREFYGVLFFFLQGRGRQ